MQQNYRFLEKYQIKSVIMENIYFRLKFKLISTENFTLDSTFRSTQGESSQ
jgi:hypothetical protein